MPLLPGTVPGAEPAPILAVAQPSPAAALGLCCSSWKNTLLPGGRSGSAR